MTTAPYAVGFGTSGLGSISVGKSQITAPLAQPKLVPSCYQPAHHWRSCASLAGLVTFVAFAMLPQGFWCPRSMVKVSEGGADMHTSVKHICVNHTTKVIRSDLVPILSTLLCGLLAQYKTAAGQYTYVLTVSCGTKVICAVHA